MMGAFRVLACLMHLQTFFTLPLGLQRLTFSLLFTSLGTVLVICFVSHPPLTARDKLQHLRVTEKGKKTVNVHSHQDAVLKIFTEGRRQTKE